MMMNKTNCGDIEARAARRSRLRRSAVAAAAALVGLTIVGCGTPVSTDTDGMAYYARLDANGEIIDNNISDGDVIVIVAAGDWALSITGTITPL